MILNTIYTSLRMTKYVVRPIADMYRGVYNRHFAVFMAIDCADC